MRDSSGALLVRQTRGPGREGAHRVREVGWLSKRLSNLLRFVAGVLPPEVLSDVFTPADCTSAEVLTQLRREPGGPLLLTVQVHIGIRWRQDEQHVADGRLAEQAPELVRVLPLAVLVGHRIDLVDHIDHPVRNPVLGGISETGPHGAGQEDAELVLGLRVGAVNGSIVGFVGNADATQREIYEVLDHSRSVDHNANGFGREGNGPLPEQPLVCGNKKGSVLRIVIRSPSVVLTHRVPGRAREQNRTADLCKRAREQNRTADLFITSDLALNAVLTPQNPTFSTVLDVRCAQSYLL